MPKHIIDDFYICSYWYWSPNWKLACRPNLASGDGLVSPEILAHKKLLQMLMPKMPLFIWQSI